MNGTNEAKSLLIDYLKTNRNKKKNSDYIFKKGCFKSFNGQNKVPSSIYDE